MKKPRPKATPEKPRKKIRAVIGRPRLADYGGDFDSKIQNIFRHVAGMQHNQRNSAQIGEPKHDRTTNH